MWRTTSGLRHGRRQKRQNYRRRGSQCGPLSPTVTTIDATEAGADTFVCTRYSDLVESIRMGKGDDSFTLRSITPNAVVDGGDGQDTGKLLQYFRRIPAPDEQCGDTQYHCRKNYAGQADPDPTAALSLDGGLTTGLETLGLTGGNGYALDGTAADARSISCPITMWAS